MIFFLHFIFKFWGYSFVLLFKFNKCFLAYFLIDAFNSELDLTFCLPLCPLQCLQFILKEKNNNYNLFIYLFYNDISSRWLVMFLSYSLHFHNGVLFCLPKINYKCKKKKKKKPHTKPWPKNWSAYQTMIYAFCHMPTVLCMTGTGGNRFSWLTL